MGLIKKIVVVLALVVFALWSLVWVASPAVARYFIGEALAPQNISVVNKSSFRLNLFRSKIVVDNLVLIKDNEQVLQLERLELRYSLARFFFREIYISSLKVDGVDISASRKDGLISVAGFDAADQQASEKPPADEENKKVFSIPINVQLVKFENIKLGLIDGEHKHRVVIKNLTLKKTAFVHDKFNTIIDVALDANGADLNLNGEFQYNAGNASTRLNLGIAGFDPGPYAYLLPSTVAAVSADVTLKMNTYARLEAGTLAISDTLLDLNIAALDYQGTAEHISVSSLDINLDNSAATIAGGKATFVSGMSAALEGLAIDYVNPKGEREGSLLAMDRFSFDDATFGLSGEHLQFSSDHLGLDGIAFSTRAGVEASDERPSLVRISSMTIDNVVASNDAVSIGEITLGKVLSHVVVSSDGRLMTLVAEGQNANASGEQGYSDARVSQNASTSAHTVSDSTGSSESEPAFNIALGAFQLDQAAEIHILDHSVTPKFEHRFFVERLTLKNVDSKNKKQRAKFALDINDGAYFSMQSSGSIRPFTALMNMEVNAKIKEFSLHEISPYVEQSLAFQVKSGQLDMDFDGVVTDSILDGKAQVTIRGSKFSAADKQDELNVIGQTAIPLNVALNMLKDGDGNIHLTVPVDGDVNDPSFGLHYLLGLVVKKAVMSQTKKHLVNTFVPYGQVLSVALSAGSFALKVRFEDLDYELRQTELREAQHIFAQQFIALMNKKEDLQVRLCPVATSAEIGLTADLVLSSEQLNELNAIAQQRSANFKRYVVEHGGIESSRLLICAPEIERKPDAAPRLKLAI